MPIITKQKAINMGLPQGEWMLHKVLFPKDKFDKEKARAWLKEKKYKYGLYRQTKDTHHFNQRIPAVEGAEYVSDSFDDGVEVVSLSYRLTDSKANPTGA